MTDFQDFSDFFVQISGAIQVLMCFKIVKKRQMLMGKSTLQQQKLLGFCIFEGTEVFKIAKKIENKKALPSQIA